MRLNAVKQREQLLNTRLVLLQPADVKAGKTLETAGENIAELTAQGDTFVDKQLPILRALQVV